MKKLLLILAIAAIIFAPSVTAAPGATCLVMSSMDDIAAATWTVMPCSYYQCMDARCPQSVDAYIHCMEAPETEFDMDTCRERATGYAECSETCFNNPSCPSGGGWGRGGGGGGGLGSECYVQGANWCPASCFACIRY